MFRRYLRNKLLPLAVGRGAFEYARSLAVMYFAATLGGLYSLAVACEYGQVLEKSAELLLALLAFFVLSAVVGTAFRNLEARIVIRIARYVNDRYLRNDYALSTRFSSGDVISRMQKDRHAATDLYASLYQRLLVCAFSALTWFCYLADINLRVACAVTALCLLGALVPALIAGKLVRNYLEMRRIEAATTNTQLEGVKARTVIKLNNLYDAYSARLKRFCDAEAAAGLRVERLWSTEEAAGKFTDVAVRLLAVAFLGYSVYSGSVSTAAAIVFLGLFDGLRGALADIFGSYTKIRSARVSLLRLEELLDNPETQTGGDGLVGKFEELRLENVSFGYPDLPPVLKNINLNVRRGEKIALIGENGSGKTTLMKIICGLYRCAGVRVNGRELSSIEPRSWQEKIAWIAQDDYLFHLPADDVLNRGGKTTATVFELPDSVSRSADAMALSGGERRKLAIERALQPETELVIADEPFNHLDIDARQQFEEFLCKTDKTVILISHDRIAVAVDRVFRMENGCIADGAV